LSRDTPRDRGTGGSSARGSSTRVWRAPDGTPIACLEKIKVLEQNLAEIQALCQDALEDAVLMGCDEQQIRTLLHAVVDGLDNPYRTAG